ncbi:MAG: DNA-processing protein DprA [bacterium]
MPINGEERLALIRLNAFACLRSGLALRLIEFYGSATEVLRRTCAELSGEAGISNETASRLLAESSGADPVKEQNLALKNSARILLRGDEGYPCILNDIPDPPLLLYIKGEISPEAVAAAVVGTRKPTGYGKKMAASIAFGLARAGAAVTSGLARGIDTAAHEAVLKAGGTTWAVLGTGLLKCYPWENRRLAEIIVEKGGTLVSEFPMNTGPLPFHFPRRNRIISGLSQAVVVVEGLKTSGAIITAKTALEQGREVLAVPGPADSPMSAGPNCLLRDGAHLAETAADVLDVFPACAMFGLRPEKAARSLPEREIPIPDNLGNDASSILEMLASCALCTDEIVEKTGWTVPRAAGALFELETLNLVVSPGGKYMKR